MTDTATTAGSSPPARGTHPLLCSLHRPRRFIPARAGNTPRAVAASRIATVHPRPRGEHLESLNTNLTNYGSSPPARGTRPFFPGPGVIRRFIPARAGNTRAWASNSMSLPVHPRPRGEHLSRSHSCIAVIGSSPPARGTPGWTASCSARLRFIPARAGNTTATARPTPTSSVHPRPRGEHGAGLHVCRGNLGSSPPARGTHDGDHRVSRAQRFIPARAGNTQYFLGPETLPQVHPRPRGEHPTVYEPQMSVVGSSPPARGTPIFERFQVRVTRFIPARAGNTSMTGTSKPSPTVHPRPRGEHSYSL